MSGTSLGAHWFRYLCLSLVLPLGALGAERLTGVEACTGATQCGNTWSDEVAYLQSRTTLHSAKAAHTLHGNELPATAAERQVLRLQAARPISWIHVPKCGTSLGLALAHLPGLCPFLPADFDEEMGRGVAIAGFDVGTSCPGSFALEGRINWADHTGLGGIYESSVRGHGFIMLRQPEQRIISAFSYHRHSWPFWYFQRWPVDVLEYAQVISGCAVRMLTREGQAEGASHDEPSPCGGPEPATVAEIAVAKNRLRDGFVFVGLTDEWDLSMCLLHAVFGGDCLATDFIDNRVKDGTNASASLYDTSELKGFKDLADGALYEEASAVFSEHLHRYGVTWESCQSSCFQQIVS